MTVKKIYEGDLNFASSLCSFIQAHCDATLSWIIMGSGETCSALATNRSDSASVRSSLCNKWLHFKNSKTIDSDQARTAKAFYTHTSHLRTRYSHGKRTISGSSKQKNEWAQNLRWFRGEGESPAFSRSRETPLNVFSYLPFSDVMDVPACF